jgi:SAM-dependent methyltransferase
MRRVDVWRPTKFVMVDGELRGDPTGAYVSVSSRLLGDLMAEHYQAALKEHARGRLLDLGCGSVPLFEAYRGLVDEILCVDWLASLHQQQHVDAFADLTQSLPLGDSTFDTVLLSDVLEHIPNPERLVAEIARVLRPGGCTVVGVPFLYWLHEIPYDFNRYTRYQLERLHKKAGLEVVQLTEIGGSPEVLADVTSKMLAHRPRLAASFVVAARWILNRGFVRRISERTRPVSPIAYIVVAKKASFSCAATAERSSSTPTSTASAGIGLANLEPRWPRNVRLPLSRQRRAR